MKVIPLTREYVALVDDEDYDELMQFNWHAVGSRTVYARRDYGTDEYELMHRRLCGAQPGQMVDHVNGDILDNRRSNLRLASASQNCMNRKRRSDCESAFKGIRFDKYRWVARIQVNGVRTVVGRFSTEIAAAIAYDQAARKHFGAFARLNFPFGAG